MRQLNEYEAELVAGGLSESDNYGDGTYAAYDGKGGWTIDGNVYGGWDGYYDLTGGQSGLYGGSGTSITLSDSLTIPLPAPSGTAEEPSNEIIVTGTRLTADQTLAWDMAFERATNEMWLAGAIGVGALAYLGTRGPGGAVAAGEVGYVFGTAVDEESIRQHTLAMANMYYNDDGADGTYDGMSESDRMGYGY